MTVPDEKKRTAEEVLAEFVTDIKTAYGLRGRNLPNAIDEEELDWPDLVETYEHALQVLQPVDALPVVTALTPTQVAAYLESGGNACPLCFSKNIEGGYLETDANIAWCNCTCNDCDAVFEDQYKLANVTLKEPPCGPTN